MEKKDNFTNEKISKKFVSQFDLVNYAIRLAENMIKTKREPRVKTEFQNRSMQILAEIAQDKDQIDEVPEIMIDFEVSEIRPARTEERPSFSGGRYSDSKKARKLFQE